MSGTVMRSTLGIALATVLLAFLMMITRSKAIPQVIGFLAMENGLFFAATSATYGMPLVVEMGVALDVLVGCSCSASSSSRSARPSIRWT
jgi:hydrogenase-4 component E